MKIGDEVAVRNIGTDPEKAESWARGKVVRLNADGTVQVEINHPGHELHDSERKMPLTVDAEHLRAVKE